MKKKPALIAAFITTIILAVAMVLIGASAFFNPNSLPISNSPTQASAASNASATAAVTQADQEIQQLKNLVTQYQQRDQQYQQRDQQYQQQLDQLSAQLQQYQGLIEALQARGIITINSNGEVFIPRRFGN